MQLAEKVLKGRQALQLIQKEDLNGWKEKYPSFQDEPYCHDRQDDVWLSKADLKGFNYNYAHTATFNLEKLEEEVLEGNEAHKVIVQFHDWFLSTLHPEPPLDAKCDKRDQDPVFVHNENNVHPSAVDPAIYLRSTDEALRQHQYCQQINVTQRHKCNTYCLRKKNPKKSLSDNNSYCRFGFPYSICISTHVRIKEYLVSSTKGKKIINGANQGLCVVKYRIEIVRKVNDRFLNSHSRLLIESWQANIDIQIILDSGKVVEYMTKYVCKTEAASTKTILSMVKKIASSANEEGHPTTSVLQKTMGKLFGERDISQQETCHLMLCLTLVACTHNFINLYLEGGTNELDLNTLWQSAGGQQTIQKSLKLSLMDVYGRRLDATFWKEKVSFSMNKASLRDMPLLLLLLDSVLERGVNILTKSSRGKRKILLSSFILTTAVI